MAKSSRRNQNKKSREELLAQLNNQGKGISKDRRGSPQVTSSHPFWIRCLLLAVELVSIYLVVLLCIKGLKSLDLFSQENQQRQHQREKSGTLNISDENTLGNDSKAAFSTGKDSNAKEDTNLNGGSRSILSVSVGVEGSVNLDDNFIPIMNTSNNKGTIGSILNYVSSTMSQHPQLEIDFTSPLEEYPQVLNITAELYEDFHPVVKFPVKVVLESLKEEKGKSNNAHGQKSQPKMRKVKKKVYHVLDLTTVSGSAQLIHPEHQEEFRRERSESNKGMFSLFRGKDRKDEERQYGVGKYDENRVNLYSSQMFQNEDNQIDGYDGLRTVHMGVDLGGPIGTRVYSFWNGNVHSVGYNHELGDYGFVIVIQYDLPTKSPSLSSRSQDLNTHQQTIWALYGHLDKSVMKMKVGQRVKKGQVIGRIGDVHENGGWKTPHVHFQLSMIEPKTHDMPGAVSIKDRSKAIFDYPDPRHILGPLY